ncbi:MAG: NAD(P)H-dependent oxidoreductase [Thalassolituus sp.]|uniref:NADPH-dependent FMN reductase n=1 Tax=Thalassolituus sp. TaxID=2030822 RepID=UPI0039821EB0
MTQIAIVSASHRADAQSLRIAQHLNANHLNGEASIVDLNTADLPLWDGSPATKSVEAVQQTMAQADGFIFVIPEWHGMVPAGLKNLLLWCNVTHLAHKPTLLVGVSASTGGAFVIAEMRGSGYKNSRLLYTPEHLLLRNVGSLWTGENSESDAYLEKRSAFAIEQLQTYIAALAPVREQLCSRFKDFGNGMS